MAVASVALAMAEGADGMSARRDLDGTTLRVTGRDLVVNGVAEVPRGLFSVHAARLSPELVEDWGVEGVRLIHHAPSGQPGTNPAPFVLDCFHDRYQPALLLTRTDWEEHLRGLGRRHGEALAAQGGRTHAVEFWNEPYLNWATKPGVNYDGLHYNLAEAAPDAPVIGRLGGERFTNLQWHAVATVAFHRPTDEPPTEEELLRLERTGQVDYLATRFMPGGVRRGEPFRWRERDYVAGQRWWVRDRSQPSWWSGAANRDVYLRMAAPFAAELKQACPEAPFVAGWGFHIFESNWRAWDLLHRPTLDALHPWIDGYGEHHYGVDPRRVAASYEIADAHMRARWNKRIGFWNTEAGGMQDPERPDALRPLPEGRTLEESRGAAAYFLRDVLTMLRHVPDKARMRCTHEPQVNSGVPAAFRLLKPLRGALMEVKGPDDGVWAVAARSSDRLTVACYNGTANVRLESLDVVAPRGTRFTGVTRRCLVERDGQLDVAELFEEANDDRWRGTVDLAPGTAQVLVFALAGEAHAVVVCREQYVGDVILQEVAAGKPATVRIALPAEALAAANRACVRWVVAGANAALRVRCNGRTLPPTGGSGPFREVEVSVASLDSATVVEFEAEGWESTVVGTASVLLESD
jgi:hypothetical protein